MGFAGDISFVLNVGERIMFNNKNECLFFLTMLLCLLLLSYTLTDSEVKSQSNSKIDQKAVDNLIKQRAEVLSINKDLPKYLLLTLYRCDGTVQKVIGGLLPSNIIIKDGVLYVNSYPNMTGGITFNGYWLIEPEKE